jgi:DNA-binding response OmpR family regulator
MTAVSTEGATKHAVLIVDDDASLLRLLKNIFRVAGYEVLVAEDGSGALDVTQRQHIDVIVMDLRMPVLDGRGFFRELRARGDTTPVLVASSHGARSAQRELGAEGAIEKPFDPDDLLEAVGNLLK